MSTRDAWGETVALLTPATRVSPYSLTLVEDPTAPPVETPVERVLVAPVQSTEPGEVGRDRVVTTLSLIFPSGTAVAASQEVRVRGLVYTVEGDPAVWPKGVVATVSRTEG